MIHLMYEDVTELHDEYSEVLKKSLGYDGEALNGRVHYVSSSELLPKESVYYRLRYIVGLYPDILTERINQLKADMAVEGYADLKIEQDLILLFEIMGIDEPEMLGLDYSELKDSGKLEGLIEAGTWLIDKAMLLKNKENQYCLIEIARLLN